MSTAVETRPDSGTVSSAPVRRHREWWPYAFLFVPVVIILAIEVLPTLGVVWLSFTDYNPLESSSWHEFVGGANYVRLVHDPQARQALLQTLYFVVLYLPASVLLGLVAAVLLNNKIRGTSFFRGIYFLPVIASWVVGATVILWFINPSSGALALVFAKLHLGAAPQLLQNPSTALATIAATCVWKFFGYNAVIFLAGLQTLDKNLDDAAQMDGAGWLKRFWYVSLPELRPISTVVIVLNLILALRLFDPIQVMTNGGPNFASTTLVMYYYNVSWNGLQFGYGSAITVLLTVLIILGAGLQFAYFRRREGKA